MLRILLLWNNTTHRINGDVWSVCNPDVTVIAVAHKPLSVRLIYNWILEMTSHTYTEKPL